jgi:hypothetical protein
MAMDVDTLAAMLDVRKEQEATAREERLAARMAGG